MWPKQIRQTELILQHIYANIFRYILACPFESDSLKLTESWILFLYCSNPPDRYPFFSTQHWWKKFPTGMVEKVGPPPGGFGISKTKFRSPWKIVGYLSVLQYQSLQYLFYLTSLSKTQNRNGPNVVVNSVQFVFWGICEGQ